MTPIPTWASWIMPQSFAPSPMASVTGFSREHFINCTIYKENKLTAWETSYTLDTTVTFHNKNKQFFSVRIDYQLHWASFNNPITLRKIPELSVMATFYSIILQHIRDRYRQTGLKRKQILQILSPNKVNIASYDQFWQIARTEI